MKSVYLVVLLSCWWLAACIESNPQPMPHTGQNDTVSAADASSTDGSTQAEVLVPGDTSVEPEDMAASDIPLMPDATDIMDVEAELLDGHGDADGVGNDADGLSSETVETESEVTVQDSGSGDDQLN